VSAPTLGVDVSARWFDVACDAAAGNRPKVVVTAVMHQLLLLAWAILWSGEPFSDIHRRPPQSAAT
jgi:hypothetical protein